MLTKLVFLKIMFLKVSTFEFYCILEFVLDLATLHVVICDQLHI